jgi:hypothetical protein
MQKNYAPNANNPFQHQILCSDSSRFIETANINTARERNPERKSIGRQQNTKAVQQKTLTLNPNIPTSSNSKNQQGPNEQKALQIVRRHPFRAEYHRPH